MKKILAFILAAVLLLSFVACGETADNDDDEKEEKKSKGTVYTLVKDESGAKMTYKLTISKGNKFTMTVDGTEVLDEDSLGMYGIEGEKDCTMVMKGEITGTYTENEDGTLSLTATSGKQKQYLEGKDAEEVKKAVLDMMKEYFDAGWFTEEEYQEYVKEFDGEWVELTEDELEDEKAIPVKLNKDDKTFELLDDDDDWEDWEDGDDWEDEDW